VAYGCFCLGKFGRAACSYLRAFRALGTASRWSAAATIPLAQKRKISDFFWSIGKKMYICVLKIFAHKKLYNIMTNLNLRPSQALKKSYLKIKPVREHFDNFKEALQRLLKQLNHKEHEEHNKNWISDFLKDAFYKRDYAINTFNTVDLTIHLGQDAGNSPVGVLIEAKSLVNKKQMASIGNINTRALQELVLYFLRQRVTNNNLEIKHLIITDGLKWFVFDAVVFEQLFVGNKTLVKQFEDFEAKRLSGNTTPFFYKDIATEHIKNVIDKLQYVYFNLNDYKTALTDINEEEKLIEIYKIFSPQHLLKLPYVADSNSLDKNFYNELLHLIGLTETKDGSKKIIDRQVEGKRNAGSLLEEAIDKLVSLDQISRLTNPQQYGEDQDTQLFNVALELCITWINRILFSKLLEAQLLSYNNGDKNYAFLHSEKVPNFSTLQNLFFQVLAVAMSERKGAAKDTFAYVPYLNSSLFEVTELEHQTFTIGSLDTGIRLPYHNYTVLKDNDGNKREGNSPTLAYLFDFLAAYDFGSENGNLEVQEQSKTLINASVLGLIFEKINGYKDGSFFTPGFITMYMCRETLRRAVVQKFNDKKGWDCESLIDVSNRLTPKDTKEANDIVNSLTICDPAVGSGHFLVSALNEIIAIKHELNILADAKGEKFNNYNIEVANDELVVTDEAGRLFKYNPKLTKSQRVQKTLFHEKQTIIENCLFGVDINPNSVKICRLRLWIELLKSAYYKNTGELETLPNIDINIKCGNSLVSKLSTDIEKNKFTPANRQLIKIIMPDYKKYVDLYKEVKEKEAKKVIVQKINGYRNKLAKMFNPNDAIYLAAQKAEKDWEDANMSFIDRDETVIAAKKQAMDKANKAWAEKEAVYHNAFEWSYEFPEILSDEGDFLGFDVVIGNPPYVDIKELNLNMVQFIFNNYSTSSNRINLYSTFVEKGYNIINSKGYLSYIIPNSILIGSSYQKIRNFIKKEIYSIIKLPDGVFEDASVETVIIELQKQKVFLNCQILAYKNDTILKNINISLKNDILKTLWDIYEEPKFNIYISNNTLKLLQKISSKGKKLGSVADFSLGITPYDKYKGHSKNDIENKIYHSENKISQDYKPLIKGENILPYFINNSYNGFIKYGSWLGAPREERFFTKPRVIVRQIISGNPAKIYAGYSNDSLYFTQIGFSIIPKEYISVFELTALLNSKLINFYHKYLFLDIEKDIFQKILIENCKNFPVVSFCNNNDIKNVIENIIEIKKNDAKADTLALEAQIDQMVYELYELTADEIKIIEESTK
jgi:adenine-specific DNA-methyltransferase